jgi:ribonuclease D
VSRELAELKKPKHEKRIRDFATKLNLNQKDLLKSLLEWRTMMSNILDEKEENLIKSTNLVQLACEAPQSIGEITSIIGQLNKFLEPQKKIILRLITEHGFINKLRTLECHNCLREGHGPAWACPFPKNSLNYKLWMKREENSEVNARQNQRRVENARKKGYEPHWFQR